MLPGGSAAPGERTDPWTSLISKCRKTVHILAELEAARSDVIGRSAEAERFDSQTPDPPEFDDPHVSNFHTRGEVTFTVAEPERGKTLLAVLNAWR